MRHVTRRTADVDKVLSIADGGVHIDPAVPGSVQAPVGQRDVWHRVAMSILQLKIQGSFVSDDKSNLNSSTHDK